MAMLAKQSWRLLHRPDSLCATVLRAKYYRNGELLKAKPVEGISYTWRSILKGLELLKKGIIWRMGNGENIKIWEDPWLLRGTTRRPITLRRGSILTRVVELLNPVTGQWDERW
jgi:hypothetical protein